MKTGRANMRRGIENVGGKLTLTSEELVFRPHKINVQRGEEQIPLAEIAGVRPGRTRLLGVPVAPNAIYVTLRSGEVREFTVVRRHEWVAELQAAIGTPSDPPS